MATSIPKASLGDSGFVAPIEGDILVGALADINSAFGGALNTTNLSSPQGQIASSLAAIVGAKNDEFLSITNQVDPARNSGRMQDAIARIYFLSRDPARPTTVQVLCTGLRGTIIPVGALAKASDGNTYTCTDGGTIDGTGNITLNFACQVTGPISCPANTLTTIIRTIPGWDQITNPTAGVVGNDQETPATLERRRRASVARAATGSMGAVRAAVLAVPNVLEAYVVQNDKSIPRVMGGVTLPANALFVSVVGGASTAIAQAIFLNKSIGCPTYGNTTVTVSDTSLPQPYPTYDIQFQIATPVPVYIAVQMSAVTGVPSDALSLIQNAIIVGDFGGGDGGVPAALIGSTIYASRFYSSIASLGSWANIIQVQIGLAPSPTDQTILLPIDQIATIDPAHITLTLV